jgi:hypothetical protein
MSRVLMRSSIGHERRRIPAQGEGTAFISGLVLANFTTNHWARGNLCLAKKGAFTLGAFHVPKISPYTRHLWLQTLGTAHYMHFS